MNDPYAGYVPVLTAVIGAASALIAVVLANRSNYQRAKLESEERLLQTRRELYRERGEELYELTSKWISGITSRYLGLLHVMYGKLSYKDHIDLELKHNTDSSCSSNFSRIEMIIDVYFPHVRPAYNRIIDARGSLNEIANTFTQSIEHGHTEGKHFVATYTEAQEKFETEKTELEKQIKNSLHKL